MSTASLSIDFGFTCKTKLNRWNGPKGHCSKSVITSVVSPRQVVVPKLSVNKKEEIIRIGVLGASGYTGGEIARLLANHPHFQITLMTADRKAGLSAASVFHHLIPQDLPDMISLKDADFSGVDAVFCCLPHGTTQEIIDGLPKDLKIVDLSADFRLRDINEYKEWYGGQPHKAPELQREVIYGLTELAREEIRTARVVANPGCYPTCVQLPLVPLLKANLMKTSNITIDAKSAISGAGRGAKEANLFTEISGGMHSYAISKHRHIMALQELSLEREEVLLREGLVPPEDL